MRIHQCLTVLAVAASLGACLAEGASAQEQGGTRIRPRPRSSTVAPLEEPRSSSGKRGEIESRLGQGEFRGAGRQLQMGQAVRGTLSRTDPSADDGTHYQEWVFRGQPGTRVSVGMSSGAFDTFLVWGRMVDGEFHGLLADDDGGEGSDSRLTAWVRDGDEYVVRANTYDPGQTGRYTLLVEEAPARPDPAAPRGDVAPGQTRTGALGDGDGVGSRGSYYEVWRYRGRPGQRVTVTVDSDAFDTHVAWAQMVGGEPIAVLADDDGGADTNSELTVQVEESGEFVVIVSAMGPGQTGAYTLRVEPARR